MAKQGVYLIRNSVTGKIYVGSTQDFSRRWREHQNHLKCGVHPAKRLLADFWRYGLEALTFEVIEEVSIDGDLIAAEQRHIDRLQPFDPAIGYNTHSRADSPIGTKRSDAHRRRISHALKGQPFTDDRRHAISEGRLSSERAKVATEAVNRAKRKLSDANVRSIIEMRSSGKTVTEIAEIFGVSRRPIRAILSGETYSDVTGIVGTKHSKRDILKKGTPP